MITQRLRESNRILIASHINPDGDALGSLVAMGLAMDALGKRVTLYNESRIPAIYRFLPAIERIVRDVSDISRYDTAILLDCGDIERAGHISPRLEAVPVVINIDHHLTNCRFGHLNYVDTRACATAEIIYRLIKMLGISISKAIATGLYTGIFTDTGSFRFANTNRAAFAICDEMVCRGVEPHRVAEHLYGTYSLGRLKLLNLALDSIEILHDGKLSIMSLTRRMMEETDTRIEDADGIINYAKSIEGIQVAILIMEGNGVAEITQGIVPFHVSLRSDGTVDVADFAMSFGGGGHCRASGFTVEMTLNDLRAEIIEWFESVRNGKE